MIRVPFLFLKVYFFFYKALQASINFPLRYAIPEGKNNNRYQQSHTQMEDPGDPIPKKIEAGPQKTIEIRISGRVQRVGMRNCIRTIAGKLNIRGEVMNQPDGTVRVVATADPILLEKFVSMIYGCPRAVVREIEISDYRLQQFSGFLVKRPEPE